MAVTFQIIDQPTDALLQTSRSIFFDMQVSGDPSVIPAALDIQLEINGSNFGRPIPVSANRFATIGALSFSGFSIDVKGEIDRFFAGVDFIPPIGQPGSILSDSYQADVRLIVTVLYPDADNILQPEPIPEYSQVFYVIRTDKKSDSDGDLLPFQSVGNPMGNQKWLTGKPNSARISVDDSEFLGLYLRGTLAVRFLTYAHDGTQLAEGHISSNIGQLLDHNVAMIGVGPQNINNIDPADWINGTDQVVIDDTVGHYIVQGGWSCQDGSFWITTTARRFYLVPTNCRKHRIHFTGRYQTPESFSIYNNMKMEITVEGQTFQKPLPPGFGLVDVSTKRLESSGRVAINSVVGDIPNVFRQWLARDFSMSTDIRVQIGSKYLPAYIEPGSFVLNDSDETQVNIAFSILYSQQDVTIAT